MIRLQMLGFVAAIGLVGIGCGHTATQPVNDPGGGSVDNTITEGTSTGNGDTTGSGNSTTSSNATGTGDVSTGSGSAGPGASSGTGTSTGH
jgi:hypothetical protein